MKRLAGRYRDTVFGLAPTLLVLLGVVLLQQRFAYLRTSFAATVSGLETGTMYLRQRGYTACLGDVVHFTSPARSSRYYTVVAADAGAVFAIGESGYSVDGAFQVMSAEWREKAMREAVNGATLTVPPNHILVVNRQFDPAKPYTNWAFEVVPRTEIVDTVTHILFSRDLSRIGERIASAQDGGCQRHRGDSGRT